MKRNGAIGARGRMQTSNEAPQPRKDSVSLMPIQCFHPSNCFYGLSPPPNSSSGPSENRLMLLSQSVINLLVNLQPLESPANPSGLLAIQFQSDSPSAEDRYICRTPFIGRTRKHFCLYQRQEMKGINMPIVHQNHDA